MEISEMIEEQAHLQGVNPDALQTPCTTRRRVMFPRKHEEYADQLETGRSCEIYKTDQVRQWWIGDSFTKCSSKKIRGAA